MQEHTGNLHSGRMSKSKGNNTSNGGSSKTNNFSGVKWHKESQCFKKNPEEASKWWKEKSAKAESASSSVEVTLTSLSNPMKEGVNVTVIQPEKCDTLAILILYQENVWIVTLEPVLT